MTEQQMTELVSLIIKRVYGNADGKLNRTTSGCTPVTLQIGFINNIVQNDGIIITDAPSVITDVVMDWIAKQKTEDQHSLVRASAGYGGLFIR